MNDFIQSLAFQSAQSPRLGRTATDVLRSIMRSFDDEVPAYRPAPRAEPRRKPRARPARKAA